MSYESVLKFWFEELTPDAWFKSSLSLDQTITERFSALHQQVAQCECCAWRQQSRGRLAEIVVLDQFSRNLFRDTAKAYAWDSMALALAQEAVALGADKDLNAVERSFIYMPFMHSESAAIHEVAVQLFNQKGLESNLAFEMQHKAIIDQFGRYPHRNAHLGRMSTAEELQFLTQPGSSF